MKKLRFYARGEGKVGIPGAGVQRGSARDYVGWIGEMVDGRLKYRVNQDGSSFAIDTTSRMQRGHALARRARQRELWCADIETAQFCRADYVPVEFSAGEFAPVKQSEKPPAKPRGKPKESLNG